MGEGHPSQTTPQCQDRASSLLLSLGHDNSHMFNSRSLGLPSCQRQQHSHGWYLQKRVALDWAQVTPELCSSCYWEQPPPKEYSSSFHS